METTLLSQQWEDKSSFQMIPITHKQPTFRRAVAQGRISLSQDAFLAIQDNTNPKGNVLSIAEVAGIQSAKRTSEMIPLCHPIPLEHVKVGFLLDESTHSIRVSCVASTTAKTGVEMEALSGLNGALLTIYDLSKAVNPEITISEMRLIQKEGGKNGTWSHPDFKGDALEVESKHYPQILKDFKTAVLTISDRCYQGRMEDLSGPALKDLLNSEGAATCKMAIVADDQQEIQRTIAYFIHELKVDLIITTGGTGVGPRDVTPEALEKLWTKPIPGIGELIRHEGSSQNPFSWLSRCMAGLVEETLVIALPGSRLAAIESFETLKRILPHVLHISRGGSH